MIAIGLVALLQTAVLIYMVADRAGLLVRGREVVLQVQPVDPRSLFQGDYVILSYPFARQTAAAASGIAAGDPYYLVLTSRDGRRWEPVRSSAERPEAIGPNEVLLRGTVRDLWRDGAGVSFWVAFGIESYFVPEGEGRKLERMIGERALQVVAAVDGEGRAAIKGLVVDGKVRLDEPLF
jgi:uncharacterized membrane-anchored protein